MPVGVSSRSRSPSRIYRRGAFQAIGSVRITRDIVALVVARFVIAPAVVIGACLVIEVPDFMRKVFIIEAAMPVMTQVSIAARAYKADANYVAVVSALTTVLSLATIPAYFILLTYGIL